MRFDIYVYGMSVKKRSVCALSVRYGPRTLLDKVYDFTDEIVLKKGSIPLLGQDWTSVELYAVSYALAKIGDGAEVLVHTCHLSTERFVKLEHSHHERYETLIGFVRRFSKGKTVKVFAHDIGDLDDGVRWCKKRVVETISG